METNAYNVDIDDIRKKVLSATSELIILRLGDKDYAEAEREATNYVHYVKPDTFFDHLLKLVIGICQTEDKTQHRDVDFWLKHPDFVSARSKADEEGLKILSELICNSIHLESTDFPKSESEIPEAFDKLLDLILELHRDSPTANYLKFILSTLSADLKLHTDTYNSYYQWALKHVSPEKLQELYVPFICEESLLHKEHDDTIKLAQSIQSVFSQSDKACGEFLQTFTLKELDDLYRNCLGTKEHLTYYPVISQISPEDEKKYRGYLAVIEKHINKLAAYIEYRKEIGDKPDSYIPKKMQKEHSNECKKFSLLRYKAEKGVLFVGSKHPFLQFLFTLPALYYGYMVKIFGPETTSYLGVIDLYSTKASELLTPMLLWSFFTGLFIACFAEHKFWTTVISAAILAHIPVPLMGFLTKNPIFYWVFPIAGAALALYSLIVLFGHIQWHTSNKRKNKYYFNVICPLENQYRDKFRSDYNKKFPAEWLLPLPGLTN